MVNYKIQSIDPMDMTGIKKQYYIMLGEIGVSYPDGTGDEEFVAQIKYFWSMLHIMILQK